MSTVYESRHLIESSAEAFLPYPDNTKGYVYIIHLARPLNGSKSRHYVGFSKHVEKRLYHHRNGSGSHFLREANRQGIPYVLVVIFAGTKRDERRLKNCKNTAKYCPCCNGSPRHLKSNYLLPHEQSYKLTDL